MWVSLSKAAKHIPGLRQGVAGVAETQWAPGSLPSVTRWAGGQCVQSIGWLVGSWMFFLAHKGQEEGVEVEVRDEGFEEDLTQRVWVRTRQRRSGQGVLGGRGPPFQVSFKNQILKGYGKGSGSLPKVISCKPNSIDILRGLGEVGLLTSYLKLMARARESVCVLSTPA